MRQSLSAVALVVPDYDAALDFYVGTLGFDLIEDTVLSEEKRWVLVAPPGGGGCRLLLARAADEAQAKAIGNQTGGRVFLLLDTDDCARDVAAWAEAGVGFEGPIRDEPYGKVAVFRDPFGTRWDLIEPA